jgi:hypothetical protein
MTDTKGTRMSKLWSVMVEYTIMADTEEDVWKKWDAKEDVDFERIDAIDAIEIGENHD